MISNTTFNNILLKLYKISAIGAFFFWEALLLGYSNKTKTFTTTVFRRYNDLIYRPVKLSLRNVIRLHSYSNSKDSQPDDFS